MKRNFEKLIEAGLKLDTAHRAGMYTDELQQLHEMTGGSEFETARLCFAAGLAAGYQIRKKEERRQAEAAAQRRLKQAEKIRRALFFEAGRKLGYSQAEIEMLLEYEAGKKGGKE